MLVTLLKDQVNKKHAISALVMTLGGPENQKNFYFLM